MISKILQDLTRMEKEADKDWRSERETLKGGPIDNYGFGYVQGINHAIQRIELIIEAAERGKDADSEV